MKEVYTKFFFNLNPSFLDLIRWKKNVGFADMNVTGGSFKVVGPYHGSGSTKTNDTTEGFFTWI